MKIISVWEEKFDKYLESEKKCDEFIIQIYNIKNRLTGLIGNQRKDDIIFYKAIINSSHFYLSESLKKLKFKFINDLNYIWNKMNPNKKVVELNRNIFIILIRDFQKIFDDITISRQHNTLLTWVKDDVFINLQDIEKEMNDIISYHTILINSFLVTCKNEADFYCKNKNIDKENDA